MTNEHHGTEVFTRRRTRRVADAAARRPSRMLGAVGLVAALLTIALFWVGMSLAVGGSDLVSTDLAYLAIGTSIVAIIGGGSAVVLGRGRALGAFAVVVGLLADPLLITRLLSWASGLG